MGSALTLPQAVLSADWKFVRTSRTVTDEELSVISAIAEAIIPRTDTPGAIDAGVPEFIVLMLEDCYTEKDRRAILDRTMIFDIECRQILGKRFAELDAEKQIIVLESAQTDARNHREQGKEGLHYFQTLKELTLLGYFSSEQGATKALEYLPVPGKYEACIPLQPGQKAWAL